MKQTFKSYEFIIVVNEDKVINMVRLIINTTYNNDEKARIQLKKITDTTYNKKKLSEGIKKLKKKRQ